MLRTITTCEKNLTPFPPALVPVAAATNVEVLPNYNKVQNFLHELVSVTIQNVGGNDCYVAFNVPASSVSYHKWLQSGQELAIPGVCSVNVYSTGGTIIATAVWPRDGY